MNVIGSLSVVMVNSSSWCRIGSIRPGRAGRGRATASRLLRSRAPIRKRAGAVGAGFGGASRRVAPVGGDGGEVTGAPGHRSTIADLAVGDDAPALPPACLASSRHAAGCALDPAVALIGAIAPDRHLARRCHRSPALRQRAALGGSHQFLAQRVLKSRDDRSAACVGVVDGPWPAVAAGPHLVASVSRPCAHAPIRPPADTGAAGIPVTRRLRIAWVQPNDQSGARGGVRDRPPRNKTGDRVAAPAVWRRSRRGGRQSRGSGDGRGAVVVSAIDHRPASRIVGRRVAGAGALVGGVDASLGLALDPRNKTGDRVAHAPRMWSFGVPLGAGQGESWVGVSVMA